MRPECLRFARNGQENREVQEDSDFSSFPFFSFLRIISWASTSTVLLNRMAKMLMTNSTAATPIVARKSFMTKPPPSTSESGSRNANRNTATTKQAIMPKRISRLRFASFIAVSLPTVEQVRHMRAPPSLAKLPLSYHSERKATSPTFSCGELVSGRFR